MPFKFLITAGPTREFIDPVRFISNPSTGMMGFALAASAMKMGCDVVLICGPAHIKPPVGVKTVSVTSAVEMEKAVLDNLKGADAVIMAAAVSDFKPARSLEHKVKKAKAGLSIKLRRNPDILLKLGRKKHDYFLAGFAAETDDLIDNALSKLRKKKLDMIIANLVGKSGTGFGSEYNEAVIISKDGNLRRLPRMTKQKMAGIIISEIAANIRRSVL